MNGDQTLILRMMMNLITNAINYGKNKWTYPCYPEGRK